MTLLITLFAAVIATALWYRSTPERDMKLGVLCWLYWGASIMWLVDAVTEYIELRDEFFTPPIEDLINDVYLGLSVVALGLVIWIIVLLVKDPSGRVKKALKKK